MGSFQIEGDGVDDVNGSEGLAVTNRPAGAYRTGLLVGHDEPETGADVDPERDATNFSFVSWAPSPTRSPSSSTPARTATRGSVDENWGPAAETPFVTKVLMLPDIPLGNFQNDLVPASVADDRGVLLGGIGSGLFHTSGNSGRARPAPPAEAAQSVRAETSSVRCCEGSSESTSHARRRRVRSHEPRVRRRP